ncbi:hypothetical protein NUW58_g8357 [Xylaria curta]|uniref:Uncharacterized protein n=1 Tax=Xylaria curta TaxID=42375 RepID=A0ACC1N9A5_9PEZI|nr:hypothetical protein NUW58_g8357 [Xylaria curta]
MSHTTQSSRTGSPPADLRPAPLRLPLRKTVANLDDDPVAVVTKCRDGERDAPASRLSRDHLSQHPQSYITHNLPQRRHPGSRLASLKSRFEILHALNSADTSVTQYPNSSYTARPSTIPRASASKRNQQRNLLSPSPSPVELRSRASSGLSPRQVRTPADFSRKSMITARTQPIATSPSIAAGNQSGGGHSAICPRPVSGNDMDTDKKQTTRPSTSYFTTHSTVSSTGHGPERDPSIVADRRKLFERDSPQSLCAASTIPILRHSRPPITPRGTTSYRLPAGKSLQKNTPPLRRPSSDSVLSFRTATEFSPTKAARGKQETPKTSSNDFKFPARSNIPHPQQRPSVADLRKSFEKFSQPVELSGEPARLSLQSKASQRSIRQNQGMLPSTSSKLRLELCADQNSSSLEKISRLQPLLFCKGQIVDVKPRFKATGEFSSSHSIESSVKKETSPLPRSRAGQQVQREKAEVLDEPVTLKPVAHPAVEKMLQKKGNSTVVGTSLDGLGNSPRGERPSSEFLPETPKARHERFVTDDRPGRSPIGLLGASKVLPPDNRPAQGIGKVSQLRTFFERSSKQISSPLSLMNFRRSRPRTEEPTSEVTVDNLSPPGTISGSPTSTHTITRRRSIVPSLTTEISVNDFFCDFINGPGNDETPIAASPGEVTGEVEPRMTRESPVKHRIQQFEHLSRDSLKPGTTADNHGKPNSGGPQSASKNKTKRGAKRNKLGNWKPIHQKGAAIWRKISSSFSRSFDSWKDCDEDCDNVNHAEHTFSDFSFNGVLSPANDSKRQHNQSSSFGYSMHRVSHTSPQFLSSSHTTPNIEFGVGTSLKRYPKGAPNTSYHHSSPDAPLPSRIVYKGVPTIPRVFSGLRQRHVFGLDGHFPSKPVQEDELQPSEGTMSGPSTPQGGPSVLDRVMLRQAAAERTHGRQDEKHLRRDIIKPRNLSRTFAKWKGKGKADAALDSADEGTVLNGKGKERGTVGKRSRDDEGQGAAETNKKTDSGFVMFESKDVKLRHPKPRRPGQVRKLANMYREKGSSGVSVNTKASSGATLKESRLGLRQKASSALGLKSYKGGDAANNRNGNETRERKWKIVVRRLELLDIDFVLHVATTMLAVMRKTAPSSTEPHSPADFARKGLLQVPLAREAAGRLSEDGGRDAAALDGAVGGVESRHAEPLVV